MVRSVIAGFLIVVSSISLHLAYTGQWPLGVFLMVAILAGVVIGDISHYVDGRP